MKLKLVYVLALAAAMTSITSCKDDDGPVIPGSSLTEKTYTSGNNGNFTLSVDGTSLQGKTATFTPLSDSQANIKIETATKADGEDWILPGVSTIDLTVELLGDAKNCTFEGNQTTENCSYSYSGAVTPDKFVFNITDVTVKNVSLSYKQENLVVTLNDTPILGKTATFTPTSTNKATIAIAGETLNLESIMDLIPMMTKANDPLGVPTAGVLPGTTDLIIDVDLQGTPGNYTFQGSGETDFCTYSYAGAATTSNFIFNLSSVKLKNTSLAGTWTIPSLKWINPDWGNEEDNLFNVARVNWVAENGIDVGFGVPFPISTIVSMALVLPLISVGDEAVSPVVMLTNVLHSVTFAEDGTLTARYVDTKTGETTDAPAGIAQYVITSEGNIRLFLNPAAIIANSVMAAKGRSTRAIDVIQLVESLMQQIAPMLSGGVPITYGQAIADQDGNLNEDPNVKSFYLGTETLLPLLKAIAPIFTDEDLVNSLVEEASKDPNMGYMAGMLPNVLSALPGVIETTSVVEIGINLKK